MHATSWICHNVCANGLSPKNQFSWRATGGGVHGTWNRPVRCEKMITMPRSKTSECDEAAR